MDISQTLSLTISQGMKESNDNYYSSRRDFEKCDVPPGASTIPLAGKKLSSYILPFPPIATMPVISYHPKRHEESERKVLPLSAHSYGARCHELGSFFRARRLWDLQHNPPGTDPLQEPL